MMPLSYHSSNLLLIALETMRLLVQIKLNLNFLRDIEHSMFFEYQWYKKVANIFNWIYFSQFHFQQRKYTFANEKELIVIA